MKNHLAVLCKSFGRILVEVFLGFLASLAQHDAGKHKETTSTFKNF